MGTEMLSANKARDLMKSSIIACDIANIMNGIEEQAKLGLPSLTLSYRLTSEVKTKLVELGYQVSSKCANVDTIYWGN